MGNVKSSKKAPLSVDPISIIDFFALSFLSSLKTQISLLTLNSMFLVFKSYQLKVVAAKK